MINGQPVFPECLIERLDPYSLEDILTMHICLSLIEHDEELKKEWGGKIKAYISKHGMDRAQVEKCEDYALGLAGRVRFNAGREYQKDD
jgi:hypothetical protein